MSKPELFAHLDRYNSVVTIFNDESDRAAAVLAASYLETLLEKLLRTKLIQSAIVDELFSTHGPLGTFASRALMAHAMGLFDEAVYQDLTLIRRIRNYFAHHIAEASFEDPAARDRCGQLWFIKELAQHQDVAELNARVRFLLAVGHASLAMTRSFHREWIDRSPRRAGS